MRIVVNDIISEILTWVTVDITTLTGSMVAEASIRSLKSTPTHDGTFAAIFARHWSCGRCFSRTWPHRIRVLWRHGRDRKSVV